ncbi:MAG: PQQ-dependent sugar dehydrogenase [Pirellulales bacterium]|nr:PQQ-dependent sugar dehydrogenase [Pirellulales bacterium]
MEDIMARLRQSGSCWAIASQFLRSVPAIVALALAPLPVKADFTGLTRVATDLDLPVFTTFAPGDPNRLFIATLGSPDENANATATIRVLNIQTGVLQTEPFLTIPGVNTGSEGGLLGLAFHPDFQTNRKFYTYLTANDSVIDTPFSSYVREYTTPSVTSPVANPAFSPILEFTQPQDNHNAGWIGFGPNDGYLYIATGDGGNFNDQGPGHTEPAGNAQDIEDNFLGKMLRIDVNRDDFPADASRNYGNPYDVLESPGGAIKVPGNPFAPNAPGLPTEQDRAGDNEIWAYGLRNPFRAGFDRATGDLWIGDVGQAAREEIDFQAATSAGGENYGWRLREGFIQTPGFGGGERPPGNVDPIYDYPRIGDIHTDPNFTGVSVVGGYAYRGPDPTLQGLYFFADTVSNRIWTLRRATAMTPMQVGYVSPQLPLDMGSPEFPVAFGEDAAGNLYITYLSGSVYRINTNAFTPGDFNGDASVDELDLAVWEAGFGMTGVTRTSGDANADGDVDGADFLVWQQNLGWSPLNAATPASSPVPEPAIAALFTACVFAAIPWRRR